ncbi:hypothetical protein [Amycolatopsis sp.]|jgi:hypothetical protein|uniref:hypothetical protein n=1 Tax=Amycolatopsis sp. TaxID=37632 RepID=UPI0026088102|nr:hypothetical protein [Amycolatopsis sp.]
MAMAGCVSMVLAGCGQAKAGTALPQGEDAAAYVSAKFDSTLNQLSSKMQSGDAVKTTLLTRFFIAGKGIDGTLSTAQSGTGQASITHNDSNKNLNDRLDFLHPAGSPADYVLLGPLYNSLEPTPWVSMPHLAGDYGPCITGDTYHMACKMLGAVARATKKGQAVKSAKHLADGTVVLQADVSLQDFQDAQVVVIPQAVLDKTADQVHQQLIHATITITPQGTLQQIEMVAKFPSTDKAGKDSPFDIDYHFQIVGPATPADIPQAPDASQVTVLPDQAAVDEFNARKDKIQGQ